MAKKQRSTKSVLWQIIVIICIIIGIGQDIYNMVDSRIGGNYGKTTGVIEDIVYTQPESRDGYYIAKISYVRGMTTVEAIITDYEGSGQIGDSIEIYYDYGNPVAIYEAKQRENSTYRSAVAIGVFSLMVIGGFKLVPALIKARKNKSKSISNNHEEDDDILKSMYS